MNRLLAKVGAGIVTVTVFLFALCLIVSYNFGSYLVCMFLPIGYILMAAGLEHECEEDRRVSARAGLVFAGIYAILVFLVYFAQMTTVRFGDMNAQATEILDIGQGGLWFSFDLLGYGVMALSTFFIGLSMKAKCKTDKWLKALMMIHGGFFPGCLIMPIAGVFRGMGDGEAGNGGTIALVIWCVYFFPIGVLAYRHFSGKIHSGEEVR